MPMNIVDVDWEIARDARFQNVVQKGDGAGAAGAGAQRPRRGGRARAGARVLVPLPRRRRSQPDRPHAGPRRRPARRSIACASRVCGCQHYEDGYFTAFRRIAEEQFDFVFHTGDYIYEGRADGGRNERRLRQHNGDEIYTLVDYRNRYALYKIGPRPDGGARIRAVGRHLGRPRGRQQLRRRHRREQHAAGAIRAAPRRRLSGVLRVDAAARERAAVGQPHAHLPPAAVRQPDRSQRPRHAAVALRSAVRRRLANQLRRTRSRRRRR